ncbi:MAG: T9SS type A sorting domain-containing protein [Candidatus Kapaibacterium sp.]
MTLSGITGVAVIAYFAFFSNPSFKSVSHRTDPTDRSHRTPQASLLNTGSPKTESTTQPATKQPRANPAIHGPWSAGNDQIYADLTREELARLGLVVKGDTVIAYKLPPNDTVESMELTMHSIGGGNTMRILPLGLHAPNFYPVLMTFGSGHGVAYVIEENGRTKEWGMVGDDSMNMLVRSWLESQGTPGYIPVWWNTRSIRPCDTCQEIDKMTLKVGKNFAKPIFPFYVPRMNGFTDSTKDAITQLANYYCGKANKPNFQWPKNLFINADTVTAQNLLDEMDSEENTSSMIHLRSVMAHLNALVPIIVRMKPGTGAPGPNDFIFWYEPSDELFNALPPMQAALFRAKLAEPPHCMNAPEAVTTEAEVTYCVSENQQVNVQVFDLMGHIVMSETQHAEAGDNIAKINTQTLPSGMYIILVQDQDGGQRTRRIWVQNANPK